MHNIRQLQTRAESGGGGTIIALKYRIGSKKDFNHLPTNPIISKHTVFNTAFVPLDSKWVLLEAGGGFGTASIDLPVSVNIYVAFNYTLSAGTGRSNRHSRNDDNIILSNYYIKQTSRLLVVCCANLGYQFNIGLSWG